MAGMREFLLILACGLLLLEGCTEPRKPPNVLLISIDSLRSDHLGGYGYFRNTSPNLDKLAEGGARFETAIAPSPWTLPSHVTMMTGRHPAAHGVTTNLRRLGEDIPTLAEAMRNAGYATAGFVSGPYLRNVFGYDRGFDVYDQSMADVTPAASRTGISSPQLIEAVQNWLEEQRQNSPHQPFFVFLHLWDVHYDFFPPPPWDTLFDPNYDGSIDGRDIESLGADITERDLAHVIALYDGEIAFTDSQLGVLFDSMEDRGLREDTLVVVTADHGEEFLEHGRIGHAMQVFDESLRVPLIISFPGTIKPGLVIEEQVRLMDLPQTVLGLTGITAPRIGMPSDAPIRDMDLSPWLRDDLLKGAFPELVAFPENRIWGSGRTSVRTSGDKLIRDGELDYYEVFDLRADPEERSKRTGRGDDLARTLFELLELERTWQEWLAATPLDTPFSRIDGGLRAQLEALGYIESEPGTDATPGENPSQPDKLTTPR